jgi:hypothetical protein
MSKHLLIATINLCEENPVDHDIIVFTWISIIINMNIDILFIQEIHTFNIELFTTKLGLKIFKLDKKDGTCILINTKKLIIVDSNHVKLYKSTIISKAIYIGGVHLSDVPSLPHHMNNMIYNSSPIISLDYTMSQLLKLCKLNRLPQIQKKLKLISLNKTVHAIIAGDFNEPSHLDINIKTPISLEMKKNGFIDSYRFIHPLKNKGITWPAGCFYKNEPKQRIDFIYTKNLTVIKSNVYNKCPNWLSDHKMVITTVLI